MSARRILLAAIVLPLSAELGARLLRRSWDPETARRSIEDSVASLSLPVLGSEARRETFPQPYFGWSDAATQARIVEEAGEYDVLLVGGTGARGLSAALGERLPGRSLRGYAFDAFKVPQPAMVVSYLLAMGHRPRAVVLVDGRDDTALALDNARLGTHPLHPHLPEWTRAALYVRHDWETVERFHELREAENAARACAARILASGIWRSCLLEHFASLRLRKLRGRWLLSRGAVVEYLRDRPDSPEVRGPPFAPDEASVADAIATASEECSISVRGMCRARGIAFLHVPDPQADALAAAVAEALSR